MPKRKLSSPKSIAEMNADSRWDPSFEMSPKMEKLISEMMESTGLTLSQIVTKALSLYVKRKTLPQGEEHEV